MELSKIHGARWGRHFGHFAIPATPSQERLGVAIRYVTSVIMNVNTEIMADNFRKFVKMLNIKK